jgi:predicted ArsR family transcriptional regulator
VLHLTGEAVRQQLLQLRREGWIEAAHGPDSERNRTGRPAAFFKLTAAGDHLFPKSYDTLATALLEAVDREGVIERVLERLTDDRVADGEPFRDLPLAEKVNALKALYVSDDPYMDVETVSDGFRLVERNCPYYNVAMQSPSICSISVNALTRALGVRVAREETFQGGDGRCAFHIYADEPVRR